MGERNHARSTTRWSWIAAGLLLGAVGIGIAAAEPGAKKNQPKSSSAQPAATGSKATTKGTNAPAARPASEPAPAAGNGDPIVARVNGQVITYRTLAEECIARKGSEVLESLISKTLVLQACREKGIKVSAAEVDEEIGRTAEKLKMTREQFLKVLKDERDLDPRRYAEDIVMPGIALKKLASPMVQVTEEDIERGFQAFFGEKMKCRWIMFDHQQNAMRVWNELKDSDADGDGKCELAEFERLVTRWSTDVSSRAIGGQIQPISHHTSPTFQELEKAAFALKDDGEISKVVQLGDAYVILFREGYIPPTEVKLEDVRGQIEAQIYDAKLRDQIAAVFQDLKNNARIENLLTGEVMMPNQTSSAHEEEKGKAEPAKVSSTKEGLPKKGASPTIRR
jgi:hypothetical protein